MDERVPLRDYVERLFGIHDQRHASERDAVVRAETDLDRRLDDLNHAHRQALEDRAAYATNDRVNVHIESETARADEIAQRLADANGAMREHLQLAVHPGAGKQLEDQEKRLRALEQWRQETTGTRGGVLETRTLVFASIAALVGMIGIVLAVVERLHH